MPRNYLKKPTVSSTWPPRNTACAEKRFITCVFGEEKDGKIMEKGTMCKMARGEMVRYMAENQIEAPEDIQAFDRLDYRFDRACSDDGTYVFVRRGKAPCSLD